MNDSLMTEHSNPFFSTTRTMLAMFIKALINLSLLPVITLEATEGMEIFVLADKH